MKKKLFLPLVLLLMFIIHTYVPAQTIFADADEVNVYEEQDLNSKVLIKIHGGDEVLLEAISEDQRWFGILAESTTGDGQTIGWIPASNISYIMPSRYCNHEWSEWNIVNKPTCVSPGLKARNCRICGLGESQEINATDHSFGPWTVVKQATCVSGGEESRTCLNCGYEERQAVPLTDHAYGDWETTVKATCTKEGERIRKCRTCGFEDKQTLEKLPHNYGDWTIIKKASCTEEGKQEHKCRDCGYTETVPIEKLPHVFEKKIKEKATDHSSGIKAEVCRNCGYSEKEESYDPDGTLRRGSKGDDVREIQQLLVDQEYLSAGGADGVFGGGTEKAVMKFQEDQGLTPDGIAWPQTIKRMHHNYSDWETVEPLTRSKAGKLQRTCRDCSYVQYMEINPEPSFAKGTKGEGVKVVQQMLTALGYNAGTADGIYGNMMDSAFTELSKDEGFTFEPGKITAEQLDILVQKWLKAIPKEEWVENDDNVNLAMTVEPVQGNQAKDGKNSITEYKWTIVNMGDEECVLNSIVLSFGEKDIRKGNSYVMVLDRIALQPDCGNTAEGTFYAGSEWEPGSMNFCAVAVSDKTNEKWISNIITKE